MRNMKRMTMLLALAVSLLMVVAVVPAAAKGKPEKPDPELQYQPTICGPDNEHPLDWDPDFGGFTFTLTGKNDSACIDVVTEMAGPWLVTITGSGANYLGVIPRDSARGDSCGGWLLRSIIYDFDADNPLILGYDGSVPAATINACGTQFGEWVDPDLDGLAEDDGDCAATDPELGCLVVDRRPDVDHPLALQAFMKGQRGGSATIHVDLP